MKTFLTALALIGVLIILVALAIGMVTWRSIPWVKARVRERDEKRILAQPVPDVSPPVMSLAEFYDGPLPSHEYCLLLPPEQSDFREITALLNRGHWIRDAIRGAEKAREQQ